jgi:glycosyltransferase involved in cell wall biosynthesis
MSAPVVSVVIPTYNRAELLGNTLVSVAGQGYRPLEVVVVDDGSDDETGAIIESARVDFEGAGITLCSQRLESNSGVSRARNVGLSLATGSLIAFLDSDDLWKPQFASTLVGLLRRNPGCGAVFCGNVFIDSAERVFGINRLDLGDEAEGVLREPFEQFIRRFPFCTSAVLTRRSAIDAVGFFDETLKQWEDADLWLRLAKRFAFAYTSALLLSKRSHDANISLSQRDWCAGKTRVLLRYLNEVRDPLTRQLAVTQIQRSQLLLQEQLLREQRDDDEYRTLLYNECSPTSLRFRLGRLAMDGPSSMGRQYATVIQLAGRVRRRFRNWN